MITSVLATFENTRILNIHAILRELKQDKSLSIKRVVYGQLFDKMSVCIFIAENELEKVLEKFLVNDIHIYPYDEEYKKKIISTYAKVSASPEYARNRVKSYYDNSSDNYIKKHYSPTKEKQEIVLSQDELIFKEGRLIKIQKNGSRSLSRKPIQPKKEITPPLVTEKPVVEAHSNISGGGKNKELSTIDRLCRDGDYNGIRNIVNKNPALNQYAKEKFIPAIRNCINNNLKKGMESKISADEAINTLKNIVCDKEIKSITSDDLTGLAGNALINICSKHDPDELIAVANLTQVQQKLNVMAFVQISECIFESGTGEKVDEEMLKYASEKINTRAILSSYDVMEPVISDLSKDRFNKLFSAIGELKKAS
jgi:hypothetical protein